LSLILIVACKPKAPGTADPLVTTVNSFDKVIHEEKDTKRLASLRIVEAGRKELQNLRFERAAQEFTKAIELDSQNPYAYYFFAEARTKSQRFLEAIDLYDQSVGYFTTESTWKSQALTLKGEIQESLKNYAQAKQSFDQALKVYSKNNRAKQGIARLSKD